MTFGDERWADTHICGCPRFQHSRTFEYARALQRPIFGKRILSTNGGNIGLSLQLVEQEGLRPLSFIDGLLSRITAPPTIRYDDSSRTTWDDPIWKPFNTSTGVYVITDRSDNFFRHSPTPSVTVIAHGYGPLTSSKRILEGTANILDTNAERNCTISLTPEEEKGLLEPSDGTPVYTYEVFLEATKDPEFFLNNPRFGVGLTETDMLTARNISLYSAGIGALEDIASNVFYTALTGGNVTISFKGETLKIGEAYLKTLAEKYGSSHMGIIFHRQLEGTRNFVAFQELKEEQKGTSPYRSHEGILCAYQNPKLPFIGV